MAFRAGGCHHERALSAEVAWLFEGLEGAGVAGVWWWGGRSLQDEAGQE